jgi:hypothetical protein
MTSFQCCLTETPILGSKIGMRRETLKALEQVRDNVVTERKQSKMQTLGASNPHNNNREKHRASKKVTSDTVDRIFANGLVNDILKTIPLMDSKIFSIL